MSEIEFIPEEYIKNETMQEKKMPPPPFQERKGVMPPPPPGARREKAIPPLPPSRERKGAIPPPLPFARKEKAVPPPFPPEARKPKLEVIEMEKKFEFAGGATTTTSPNHPERNEDNFFLSKKRGFGGVFDGMGGEAAGEVASFEASRVILEQVKNLPENISAQEASKKIQEAILAANDRIRRVVEAHPEYRGTGCTASIAKLCENGKKIVVGQVGDSRVYRLREGRLERISPEDSYVELLKKYGFISDDQDVTQVISAKNIEDFCNQKLKTAISSEEKEELDLLKQISLVGILKFEGKPTVNQIRHLISNAISGEEVKPHILTFDVNEGDQYIITSDGVHDNLTDAEIQKIASQFRDKPQEMSDVLVKTSYSRMLETHPRAKADDATAVVISVAKVESAKKEATKAA
ncbi:MAG: protein phosphatase 2C domain-containing protein [Candidatus Omnitrophica bacterium]|nr:protein phosphatase 2C domain-containing protein [Candidatus Omnitrophota bacterium]